MLLRKFTRQKLKIFEKVTLLHIVTNLLLEVLTPPFENLPLPLKIYPSLYKAFFPYPSLFVILGKALPPHLERGGFYTMTMRERAQLPAVSVSLLGSAVLFCPGVCVFQICYLIAEKRIVILNFRPL